MNISHSCVAVSVERVRSVVARGWMAGVVLGLIVAPALSAPITTPTGLNPGDQYRLAFITSSPTTATSTNIGDYNSFVTGVANTQVALAALATTWTAIGSTSSVDARDNTTTNPSSTGVAIFLLDGVSKIADSNADLWDGTIANTLNITEAGNALGSVPVWTGTASNGTKSTAANATELGAGAVASGLDSSTASQWIFAAGNDAISPNPFYAISGVLTVAAPVAAAVASAPTLSGAGLLGLATLLAALGVWTLQQRFALGAMPSRA